MPKSHQGASLKVTPILFSAPMIRALLDGRKTQTRRVIKPKLIPIVDECLRVNGRWVFDTMEYDLGAISGRPGDLKWVRESWTPPHPTINPGVMTRDCYRATNRMPGMLRWKPSIHMPRWASRLTLELTAVRVQRLQDISEEDAIAEGCFLEASEIAANEALMQRELLPHIKAIGGDKKYPLTVKSKFSLLWSRIHGLDSFLHGPESWEANPWVWALTFRVHQQNIDAFLEQRRAA